MVGWRAVVIAVVVGIVVVVAVVVVVHRVVFPLLAVTVIICCSYGCALRMVFLAVVGWLVG